MQQKPAYLRIFARNITRTSPLLTGLLLFFGVMFCTPAFAAIGIMPSDTLPQEPRPAAPDTLERQMRRGVMPSDSIQQEIVIPLPERDEQRLEERDQQPRIVVPDTAEIVVSRNRFENHSPRRATMLSVALPGLGQAYNGKYWKIPIIYAGFAGVGYAVNFNNQYYQEFRRAYYARVDGNPNTTDEYPNVSTDRLNKAVNYYRRNLEVSYIVGAVVYILNVLDATVDAHLIDFDVSENLSLNLQPAVIPSMDPFTARQGSHAALRFTFRF